MELLGSLPRDQLALPLLPPGGGKAGAQAALKSSSLSRMGELHGFLARCDDPDYLKRYIKMLGTMPRELLDDLARKIKARSAWLSAEEQREYKRAKLLNVMGGPGSPPRGAGHGEGADASPGTAAGAAAADAFCSEVLGGGSGEVLGLERLEMEPLHHQTFLTPTDTARTKLRVAAQQQQQPGGSGGHAAGSPDDVSPGAAGVTAHRISPDGLPAPALPMLTPVGQPLLGAAAGSGRVRLVTLQPAKQ